MPRADVVALAERLALVGDDFSLGLADRVAAKRRDRSAGMELCR